MAFSLSPNFDWIESRSKKRATKNASVAPMLDANETMTTPQISPKMAPATSVMMAAPGRDNAVTAM